VDNIYEEFPVRLIVAGSRTYSNYEEFVSVLEDYIKQFEGQRILFYSGMAKRGADAMIVRYCDEHPECRYYPYPADWDNYGKGAGFMRNEQMALTGTHLLAFWDDVSHGTKHMIETMQKEGKPYSVVHINQEEHFDHIVGTFQLAHWREWKKEGYKLIDTTVKSGLEAFSPTPQLLATWKRGELSEAEYEASYRQIIDGKKFQFEKHWNHLLEIPKFALGCYCPINNFCHRHILLEIVVKYLEDHGRSVKVINERKA
jgi:hypothetical protein